MKNIFYLKHLTCQIRYTNTSIINNIRFMSFDRESLFKVNKSNIIKAYDFLNNKDYLENHVNSASIDSKLVELIKHKVQNNDFMDGYEMKLRFSNITVTNPLSESGVDSESGLVGNYTDIDDYIRYVVLLEDMVDNLESDKIYKMIFRWECVDSSDYERTSVQYNTSHGVLITQDTDVEVLLHLLYNAYVLVEMKYGFSGVINLDVFVKEWINETEFKSFQLLLSTIKDRERQFKLNKLNKVNKLNEENNPAVKQITSSYFNSDISKISRMSITSDVIGLKYGELVSTDDVLKYNLNIQLNINSTTDKLYYFKKHSTKYILVVSSSEGVNNVSVYLFSSLNTNNILVLEKWMDLFKHVDNKLVVDRISFNTGIKIQFIESNMEKLELEYNTKFLKQSYRDYDRDDNIGVIDIETYKDVDNNAIPYAIGFKDSNGSQMFYSNADYTPDHMILECIDKMLINTNHNFKFYAHNMGNFDGILILKALMRLSNVHNYKFKIYSDNVGNIISIDIIKPIKGRKIIKITILDSFLILPFNLRKLGHVFNCDVVKGIFPYDFLTKENIFYSGDVPDFKYYNDINIDEYNIICNNYNKNWSSHNETISYLNKDLDVLYQVMHKFNKSVFREYNINITRIRTISGLAFLIFTANYYKSNSKPIYFVNGKLEKFIREGYYGGIVDLITNYTDYKTYKYDVNSHYPSAMLMPMPGGKPRISNEKELDKIFGFVEATVKAPALDELKVPILPIKVDGKTELFRGTATGIWWSEELKMAREFGYKILDVKSSVQFDKVEGLFDDYINNIYNKKKEADLAKDDINRLINKLLLNSLYGRLGINNNNISLKIVEESKIEKLLKTEDSDILFKSNNKYLIKTNGPIEPEMLRIIQNEKLYDQDDKNNDFNSKNPWGGLSSSVQMSAAITAYARMYLNRFKNIPDNPYLGGDTDSIILTYPLNNEFVGDKLGLFKLENIIIEGFYLSKKFYLNVTDDNKIIIKAKGINNTNNLLNYNTFMELFKGNNVTVHQIQFKKHYDSLNIKLIKLQKVITGIKDPNILKKLENRKIVKLPLT